MNKLPSKTRRIYRQKTILIAGKKLLSITLLILLSICNFQFISAQGVIPTKGKDFWVGFPQQPNVYTASKRCELFITSDISTIGIVTIPQQGWSTTFNVTANQTTTVLIPLVNAEHTTSEVIDNKGIHIETQDTVSVFAISFQNYSADATVVYPKQSLGTDYRVSSYPGLNGYPSQLLVVATEDNTQFTIIPRAITQGGSPANIPITVNLDAGQSYQLRAQSMTGDLTGSTIEATDSSGTCRPFAVFSGTACVNVPIGCLYCDVLYDQALPVMHWGNTYYVAPFSFAADYTFRILADENNTSYSIDGGPPANLNAGQFFEMNNVPTAKCITANKPISVIQYMQGLSCSGAGDPAMMYLNSHDQKISDVTFSTVTSTVITQHNANVIINTAHIGQLQLNGVNVPASSFTPFPGCSQISYAQLSLVQGSHTLTADSGFAAYVYGTGSAESYAYSVGAFSKEQPIQVDSVLCSSDTINLGTSSTIYNSWWSTVGNPNDTIYIGQVLTLYPPLIPEIYIQHGFEYISGCDVEFYFAVEVPDPPQTSVTSNITIACQNNLVQLNVTTIPASSQYQYSWTPTTGLSNPNIANPVLTATTSGWYHVAISANSTCTPTVYDSIYIEVLQLPIPNAGAGSNQVICEGDSVSLTATGGVSYSWNPGGFATATISVSPVVTTSYVVFVTDSNGCQNSDTVSVIVNSLPVANAGNDVDLCEGSSTLLVGTGGTSYLWNPGGMVTGSVTVSPVTTTTYTLQVTDANGCQDTDDVTVNVHPKPPVSAGADQSLCIGYSVTLTASGASTYTWNPGGNGISITVSPVVTSSYILTGTDNFGCMNRDTIIVTVIPSPVASAGADQTICNGEQAALTATGGVSWLWNPGGFNTANISVNPVVNTMYYVQVTDVNGCTDSDSVWVYVNQLPVADAGADQQVCTGLQATLTASGGVGYTWNPGGGTGSTINVSPSVNTQYTVTVTDTNGCQDTDSVLVLLLPLPAANAGNDAAICIGASTTLTGSGGISYLWQPGGSVSSNILVSPVSTSNFVLFVTDANGCQNSDTVQVVVNQLPNANAGANQAICMGSAANLNATGGVSFTWMPGGNINNPFSPSPVSNTIYWVIVTDVNGCTDTDSVLVSVNPLPVTDAGLNQTMCFGNTVNLTATGGVNYVWNPGTILGSTISISPPVSTTYLVQVTDVNGCVNYDSVAVNVNPLPLANAGTDQLICPRDAASLNASGGVSYLWNPGGITGAAISVTPLIATQYIVEVTDANGCVNTDTIMVDLHPVPESNFTTAAPICKNNAFTFVNNSTVTQGALTSFQWTFGDGGSSAVQSPEYVYANTGTFDVTLIVISDVGCTDTVTRPVLVNTEPVVDFVADNECVDIPVMFQDLSSASPNELTGWLWEFGDGHTASVSNPAHAYAAPGWYDVKLTVTSDSGCTAAKMIQDLIEIYPLPVAGFTFSPNKISILNPVVYFHDQSYLASLWLWNFDDNSGYSDLQHPVYIYSDTGMFSVEQIVISSLGCRDTAYNEIYICPFYNVYVPNAFTPNGDGINDAFQPLGTGIRKMEMIIYDRWGKGIFMTDKPGDSWNGDADDGRACAEGVYVFKLWVTDFNNTEREVTGQVNLIR